MRVYDSVAAKTGQSTTAPAIITSKTQAITTTNSNTGTTITASSTTTAIEKKVPQSTVTSSVDPYANTQAVVTNAGTQATTTVNEQVTATPTDVNSAVDSIENDSRFKSGEEVLANTQSTQLPNGGVEVEKTSVTETVTSKTDGDIESVTATVNETNTTVTETQPNTATTADNSADNNTEAAVVTAPSPEPKRPENAAQSLIMDARDAVAAGNYEKAASSLERAHSIEPKNAKILYDIAQIRYAQGKYVQSESFASKAAGLSSDNTLSKKIWTLLANSRKALGNQTGAQLAQQKANSF